MCGLHGIHTMPPDHAVVPPTSADFSNTPTLSPCPAAVTAAVSPAAPVPSTTTSYSWPTPGIAPAFEAGIDDGVAAGIAAGIEDVDEDGGTAGSIDATLAVRQRLFPYRTTLNASSCSRNASRWRATVHRLGSKTLCTATPCIVVSSRAATRSASTSAGSRPDVTADRTTRASV